METGIYGVAMRVLEMLVIIPVYFMNSVLPILMRQIKEKSDKVLTLIQYSFDFLVAASFPILVGIGVFATDIIRLISKDAFASQSGESFGSDIALKILMFALVFSFINSLFGFIIVAIEKQMKLLWINSICVLFNVVTNIIFIPVYGFIGASFTSVFSELFIFVATFYAAKKYFQFKIHLGASVKMFFSALIMGAVVYFLHPYFPGKKWLVLIPLGAFVYGGMLMLTGVVNKEMRKMILKK